jgi:hypothetical protein
MRPEEITLESIEVERPDQHPDLATYRTAAFRILPADHPNSFVVPISVNLDQYTPEEVETQARFIFHRLMHALAQATQGWNRPSADKVDGGDDAIPASATDARLGPAADPAEGKRDDPA